MKYKLKHTLLLIGLLYVGLGSSLGQQVINKSFSGIEILEIKSGAIEIQYEGQDNLAQIELEAFLGPEENADKDLVMITVGNTLKIAYDGRSNSRPKSKRYLRLIGPSNIQLKIKSSSGATYISGVSAASHQIEASSGQMRVSDINGNLSLKASSGNVQLAGLTGNLNCKLTSGNATIENVVGDINFKATSGQLKINSLSGLLNAKLTSGNIKLNQIGELGNLEVSSGNIRAENAGLGLNTGLNASSGNIQIYTDSNLSNYNFDLKAGSGNIRVGNQSGKSTIYIDNGKNGTIVGKVGSGNISIQQL